MSCLTLICKHGLPGLDEWRKIVAEHGEELEDTVLVRTPSGGKHVYYCANGYKVASSQSTLAEGVRESRGRIRHRPRFARQSTLAGTARRSSRSCRRG